MTGTELRRPGEPLGPGEIYDANGVILAAALERGRGGRAAPAGGRRRGGHRAAVERGLAADVLVTTGGVSVGLARPGAPREAELGVEEVFWRVAVRPGKPIAFGVRGATLVFGLPGNPVSSLVGFELFVRPALLALQGDRDPDRTPAGRARGAPCGGTRARDSLLRARTASRATDVVLEPVTGQESHMIAQAAMADALVLVPRGDGELEAGERVRYLTLASRRLPQLGCSRRACPRDERAPDGARGPPARPDTARSGPRRARQLRADGEPDEHERTASLDVADRDEREQVPRRVEPEPEPRRERRAGAAARRGRAPRTRDAHESERGLHLRQPEPGVQRRQQEEERERVRGDDQERGDAEREQRDGVTGELLLRSCRPARDQALARDQPAGAAASRPSTTSDHRRRLGQAALRAAGARRRRPARRRARRRRRAAPTKSQKPSRLRRRGAPGRARSAAAGRGRTDRSRREERHERGDQHELDRPAADESRRRARRSSSSPARARGPGRASRGASAPTGRAREARGVEPRVSPKAGGGVAGAVVSVIAGMPRATNGPCS